MPVLRFTREWVDPILDGRKTQTLRKNVARTVRPGEVVDAQCGSRYRPETFAQLEVISVEPVALDDLTRGDARREAVTYRRLIDGIQSLYPGVSQFTRVIFRVVVD